MDLIQSWYDDRYSCTLHFDTSLIDLDFDSTSQECQKADISALIISQSFQFISMECRVLLRLCQCEERHTHFSLSIQYSWERTLLVWLCFKKNLSWLVFRHSVCCHNLMVCWSSCYMYFAQGITHCWVQHDCLFTSCRAGLVELRSLRKYAALFAQLL